ncbi:hypothetical protein QQS21_010655 [Conoideocrella luteorostrata]|uniref:MOSC domain-containing protein n=1 Tax=Conoideocrella luteorostrata TaxID=1105319 RepID=A0AAJ0FP52_9HYPO|nr:hypothetical protein QQS21_010655 [Conoideocrella luteorostrata]
MIDEFKSLEEAVAGSALIKKSIAPRVVTPGNGRWFGSTAAQDLCGKKPPQSDYVLFKDYIVLWYYHGVIGHKESLSLDERLTNGLGKLADKTAAHSVCIKNITGNMCSSGLMGQLDYGAVFLVTVTIVVFMVPVFILFPPIPVDHSDALRQTHSKIGLQPHQSNLRSQYTAKHQPQPGKKPRIESLYIYPIKSCRGIELDRSKVLPTGLEHDRLYMLAQLKPQAISSGKQAGHSSNSWEFLTLRQLPLMANIKVDIWLPDPSKKSRQLGHLDGGFIVVRFPWQHQGLKGMVQLLAAKISRGLGAVPEKEFILPLEFPSKKDIESRRYQFEDVKIWVDVTQGLNMSRDLPPELATYLGAKYRLGLFRADPSNRREVFRCAPPEETLGYQSVVDFQDAYPVHLLNLTSIRALESQIQKDERIQCLDACRFRGNILVSGAEPYDEDEWRTVQFKNPENCEDMSTFDVPCRTVRCKLPNVDPATGIRHKLEPDHALRKYRDIDEGAPKMGCLGMQLCPIFPNASPSEQLNSYVEVGMDVDVIERGSHHYLKQSVS